MVSTAFRTWVCCVFFVVASMVSQFGHLAFAHDDGRYADSPLKPWFDALRSDKGLCCSFADGQSVLDIDWDTKREGEQVHYRARLDGEWIVIPDAAVITEPNRYGRTVIWPYKDMDGKTQVRCFMPGAEM
jgi:hypothetical protein